MCDGVIYDLQIALRAVWWVVGYRGTLRAIAGAIRVKQVSRSGEGFTYPILFYEVDRCGCNKVFGV